MSAKEAGVDILRLSINVQRNLSKEAENNESQDETD